MELLSCSNGFSFQHLLVWHMCTVWRAAWCRVCTWVMLSHLFCCRIAKTYQKSCRAWAKGSCLKLDLVKTEVFLWWFEKRSVAAEVMVVLLAWDSILTPRPWVWARTYGLWGERVRQHMVLGEKTGNDSTISISFLSGRILHLKTLNNCGVSKTWQTGLLICLGNDA